MFYIFPVFRALPVTSSGYRLHRNQSSGLIPCKRKFNLKLGKKREEDKLNKTICLKKKFLALEKCDAII